MALTAILAGLCLLGGTMALYLASSNQRLRETPFPAQMQWAGWGLLAVGQVLLWTIMGIATALFTSMTAAMLLWTVVPLAVAWRRGERARK